MRAYRVDILYFFCLLGLCLYGCNEDIKPGTGGLVLTADDGYVSEWYEYLDFLNSFNSKISFYITNYSNLSSLDKVKLSRIDSMGHEVEFHGTNHVNFQNYILEHSIEDYLKYEIEDGLSALTQDGYNIKHFAYPYGPSNREIDSILIKYFTSVRKVTRIPGNKKLKRSESVYYDVPVKEKIIRSTGIDNYYNIPENDIFEALDKAKAQNKILMLYCHRLSDEPGDWNIPKQKFEDIVTYCYYNDIPMITIEEAYNLNKYNPLSPNIQRAEKGQTRD